MTTLEILGRFGKTLGRAATVAFGYDAAREDNRRRRPASSLKSEDAELDSADRRKIVATSRNIQRNYSIAAWMIRKHLDYVSTFAFQSKTGDEILDTKIEKLVETWSKPTNFDVAGRHGLRRFLRLAEARRTIDGDVGILKIATGHLQGIEGDRIRNPFLTGEKAAKAIPAGLVHGVQLDPAGRAIAYALNNRMAAVDGFQFDRMVAAENLILHGYFDRFDQVRGISPLAPSLNTLQDTYEGITYALGKAKIAQLFALAFYRDANESLGDIVAQADATSDTDTDSDSTDSESSEEAEATGYSVNFGRGPAILDLDPGDRAEVLESKQPSAEFREFTYTTIAAALKALDIPFSFYNESFSTYSGSREALLIYEQSAEQKRADNRDLLLELTKWRLSLAILDGELELPVGLVVDDLGLDWVSRGLPWIDPLKEVDADRQAVESGFSSTVRVCKRLGLDAYDLVDEEAAYQKHRAAAGLGPGPARMLPAGDLPAQPEIPAQ